VSFLVDTNVLCEPSRKTPDPKVVGWLQDHRTELYVSCLTLGELLHGVERLPPGKNRRRLEAWLEGTRQRLDGRILSFNVRTAEEWGRLLAELEKRGQPMPTVDSQIAATARRFGFIVVTDNTQDFRPAGVRLLNPYDH
jgi:toxin FitB